MLYLNLRGTMVICDRLQYTCKIDTVTLGLFRKFNKFDKREPNRDPKLDRDAFRTHIRKTYGLSNFDTSKQIPVITYT